jgi:hypothetical protein
MNIASAIETARKAGYNAIQKTFLEKFPAHQWKGILLNPGQMVLTQSDFIHFVKEGCKDPATFSKGTGFQSVLNKHIDERLAELHEAQRPFVEPVSPEIAQSRRQPTPEEMEQYSHRKAEIEYLEKERITIHGFLESLTPKRVR